VTGTGTGPGATIIGGQINPTNPTGVYHPIRLGLEHEGRALEVSVEPDQNQGARLEGDTSLAATHEVDLPVWRRALAVVTQVFRRAALSQGNDSDFPLSVQVVQGDPADPSGWTTHTGPITPATIAASGEGNFGAFVSGSLEERVPYDLSCVSTGAFACNDSEDNDDDGLIDFSGGDPDCSSETDDSESPIGECSDGIDNDDDGYTDSEDCSCVSTTIESNPCTECNDFIDNDFDGSTESPGTPDGKIDYPADPGCTDIFDDSEANDLWECSDGIDNDGDGFFDTPSDRNSDGIIDAEDLGDCGCANGFFEGSECTECNDLLDNDGNGLIDYSGDDSGCTDIFDDSEANETLECPWWNPSCWV